MSFQKAKREQVWAKVLLMAPAGGGKSYSALRLATGLAKKCNSDIAVLDTENRRIRYYANEFEFCDMQIEEPYEPEKYIKAIDEAVNAGFKVIILDSITHEWSWCKETVEKIPGSNSFTKWAKITPRHQRFTEKILQAPIHIIATVRGKDEYVLEDKNGKQVPKKVGVGADQRGNLEYEYTVTFNIDQETHVATPMKDNTHIFEGKYDKLTEKHGEMIYDWANNGEIIPNIVEKKPEQNIDALKSSIQLKCTEALESGIERSKLFETISNISGGEKNYTKINDYDMLVKIELAITEMIEGE